MKFSYRIVHFFLRMLFRIFYHHKVIGLEHFPKGAALLASNHNSFIDPPLIGASAPEEVYYFAKASLFKHFFLGFLITRLNAYPVKGSPTDSSTFKVVASFLEQNKKVLIFPEGVRSFDGHLCPFKNGAAMIALRSNCPIVPVYVHGTFEVWSRSRRFPKLWGKTACIFGKPIALAPYLTMEKKEAQEKLTQDLYLAIDTLRRQYQG